MNELMDWKIDEHGKQLSGIINNISFKTPHYRIQDCTEKFMQQIESKCFSACYRPNELKRCYYEQETDTYYIQ